IRREGVVMLPKGMGKGFHQLIHIVLPVIHILFPDRTELFPVIHQSGEGTDAALRMVVRPRPVVAPGDRPAGDGLDRIAHLPPPIPERPLVDPRIHPNRSITDTGLEKSGCSEETRLALP